MRRPILAAAIVALALFSAAEAKIIQLKGKVLTFGSKPLADVQVRIEVTGVGPQKPATTNTSGEFQTEANLPDKIAGGPVFVTFLFSKDGHQALNSVRECRPVSAVCDFSPFTLQAISGASSLSPEEKNALSSFRSQDRNTLFVVPFHLDPAPQVPLDMPKITNSLRQAIIKRFQDLENRQAVRDFAPFDPVGLRPLPSDVITPDEESDTEKLKAVGSHLNALALITATGEVRVQGNNQLADVRASFLALPEGRETTKLWNVEERGVPVSLLGSIRLSDRLSPLWGHNALLAVCRREFAEALAANDVTRLKRVRAYLLAEKSLASGTEQIKVGDIDRLVGEIDRVVFK